MPWNTKDVSSGIYFYQLQANGKREIKNVVDEIIIQTQGVMMKHFLHLMAITLVGSNILLAQLSQHANVQTSNEYKRINKYHQMGEQNIAFRYHCVKKYSIGNHSFTDPLVQFPLILKEKPQKKILNNVLYPQSNIYIVDTASVFSQSDTSRIIYTYHKSGIISGEIIQQLVNNQWINYTRRTITTTDNGDWLSELNEKWENSQWVNISHFTYTYDGSGNPLSSLWEVWTNNNWVNSNRQTFTYDIEGNKISYLYERWKDNQWENDSRSTSTYDVVGNMLSDLYERWTNNQWEYYGRYTSVYNTNGNKLSYLVELQTNNQWVNFARYTYSYDNKGNVLSSLSEKWTNNQWINVSRHTLSYDTSGNQLSDLDERWVNNQWVNFLRNICAFDANNNMLMELDEQWINNEWLNYTRSIYEYFQNTLWSEGKYEQWINSSWILTNNYFFLYDNAGNSFGYNGYKVTISYKLIVTGAYNNDGMVATEYSLSQNYPNPFNPTTTIRYSLSNSANVKLAIYDLLGREIAALVNEEQSAGLKEVEWNVNSNASGISAKGARQPSVGLGYASGVYFYKLQAGEFQETKRMILLK
ncbi:MAG: T9SS type A sorting domain-containing protein [Bacteroidota bacterium]